MIKHIEHLVGHIADFALIILAGSTVYAGLQHKYAKSINIAFTVFDWVMSLGVAGFTGVMSAMGAYAIGVNNELALLWISGAGAVLGLKSFNVMFDIMGDYIIKIRGK